MKRLFLIAGVLAACLAAGFALHFLVERPLLNLTRRKPVPQHRGLHLLHHSGSRVVAQRRQQV